MQEELQGGTATTDEHVREDGFYTYVPMKFAKDEDGKARSTQTPFSEIHERFRRKIARRNEGATELTYGACCGQQVVYSQSQ